MYENPKGTSGFWRKHFVFERVEGESPPFLDVDGDGKPEIVAHWEGQWGFIQPDWSDPTRPWTFKPITDKRKWEQFYHGTGVGYVNGDGRRCRYKWNATTKHAKHTKRIRRRACDLSQTPNSTGGN